MARSVSRYSVMGTISPLLIKSLIAAGPAVPPLITSGRSLEETLDAKRVSIPSAAAHSKFTLMPVRSMSSSKMGVLS